MRTGLQHAIILAAALGLAVLPAPAAAQGAQEKTSKHVTHYTDKFTGVESWHTDLGNVATHGRLIGTVWKIRHGDGTPIYNLDFTLYSTEWAFLEENTPSVWILDLAYPVIGQPGDGGVRSAREIVTGGIVERASYTVTPDQLERMARSGRAEFRLKGSRRNVEGELGKKAKERISEFLAAVR